MPYTLLALLCLWQEELGRGLEVVSGHQHQLLELQELLDVLVGGGEQTQTTDTEHTGAQTQSGTRGIFHQGCGTRFGV